MTRTRRLIIAIFAVLTLPALAGCAERMPDPPDRVGEDYPVDGVPTEVAWPSDWLEGFTSESDAVGGAIVALRLEYHDDRWMWRVTSHDPKRDWADERVTDPARGREAIIDASDLSLLQDRHVQLPDHALARIEVGTAEAARLSGETFPSPRLVELELANDGGEPVWNAKLMDIDTGDITETSIDALGEGETVPPAKP